jgi:hypothetical protein
MGAILSEAADIATIVRDPDWFAHRYDAVRDAIVFLHLPRALHATAGFLKEPQLSAPPRTIAIPRAEAAHRVAQQPPLHFIFHSGLTLSTLIVRALDRPGVAMAFNEPPILTDVVALGAAAAGRARQQAVLGDVLALLGRPFAPNEPVIVKVGSVANMLAPAILAMRPQTRALCLHAPLPEFLAAMARKGLWGRLWGRKLFIGLNNAGIVDLGFEQRDYFEQADLQLAALAWLAMQRMMARVLAQAPERVRSLVSEDVAADPGGTLQAVACHFGLAANRVSFDRADLMDRHAKTGEAYDMAMRGRDLRAALATHGDEIAAIASWIGKVAAVQGIPLELPDGIAPPPDR